MSRQTLLLVDDSADIQELVQIWLAEEPVDIHLLDSGTPTVEQSRRLRPDLVLLDVDLPDVDGFEVCRRLKADPLTADIPVVFLTGAASTEEKLRGLDLGATDYVTKPFDPAELRARVRSALQTKRLMDLLADKARTLAASEEGFRVLAENSSDAIARHRPDGTFVYVSPAAEIILGDTPAALAGTSLFDRVHPQDRAAVVACYFEPRGPRETGTVVFRYRRPDGRLVWLESTCRTLIDPAAGPTAGPTTGVVREVHASTRDVTVRKQMELRDQVRADVLEMIAQDLPLDDVFRCLTETAERQEPGGIVAGVMLRCGIVRHYAPNLAPALASAIERHMTGLIDRFETLAASHPQRVLLGDVQGDAAWNPLRLEAETYGLRACWAVLIRNRRREAVGVFALYCRSETPLEPASGELLKMSGELIEVAVEQRQLTDALAFQARHDPLTRLANRGRFHECLQQTLELSARTTQPAAVVLIDVDHFKAVNDSQGHQAGDAVLCEVARRLGGRLRSTDVLARIGGDEFAVILTTLADPADAHGVALSLVGEFRAPIDLPGGAMPVSVSIGSAVFPRDGTDSATLLSNADLALYDAKEAGRNAARAFEPAVTSQAAAEARPVS